MDISAIKRKANIAKKEQMIDSKFTQKIAIRLNTTLHNTMHNYLEAMYSSGDYTYSSMADVLRKVLTSMQDKSLKYNTVKTPVSDDYIELTFRCTNAQKQFWQTLPSGNKTRMLKNAIISFLQN